MRGDIKSLLMSGVHCKKQWENKPPDTPGGLNKAQMSQELLQVVTSQPRQKYNPTPVLPVKDTPHEKMKKMAGFEAQIHNPIGMDKNGEIIKNKSTKSVGITCFGGNNPAIYMKKKTPEA